MMANPLRDAAPAEIPLATSPLHRVLIVINFPAILKISEESGIIKFQDRIRDRYPILHREQQTGIEFQLGPQGEMMPSRNVIQTIWRFVSGDDSWRVSLGPEFIALETAEAYESRDDFLDRFRVILDIFIEEFKPSFSSRIGVRYLNVIDVNDIGSLQNAVRTGLRSLSDTEIAKQIDISNHLITFNVPEGKLHSRWGVLPPNLVHDPNILTPKEVTRWYLDLDCVNEESQSFGSGEMLGRCRTMMERIYSFFRWSMTDEFIEARRDA
jgi:uncharacterized protein (TIGR04255 family)